MDILIFLQSIVDKTQAQLLICLITANLILGTVAALSRGEFELGKLKDFGIRVATVFGIYLAVALAAIGLADFTPLRAAAWVALMGYLVKEIVENLRELGIPIPEQLINWTWLGRKKV